ncbi:hypothetical protein SAMN05421539_106155 [Jannaschia seohaensis]|uniref:Hemolysin type calcium-binding protein n=2 Tax=Jannaschia seohaensis TaxID=475081 RepID=A0A2Y9B012_9RHOB|nr:hypothetical protein BCF38_106155 [Jannaschia seohaensis]SSA47689.1 hypothetical protein SAMN05421539_106155 [Jannaschia seohaensis]
MGFEGGFIVRAAFRRLMMGSQRGERNRARDQRDRLPVEGSDAAVDPARGRFRIDCAARFLGEDGDTEMLGNAASNVLASGGGNDVMTGGEGADDFAFQRTDPPPDAAIMDFDTQDKLLLDDRFFGLGDSGTDPRALAPADIRGLLNDGLASFSLRNKQLFFDIDGRDGPGGCR